MPLKTKKRETPLGSLRVGVLHTPVQTR